MFADLETEKSGGVLLEQSNDVQEGMLMLSTAVQLVSNVKCARVLPWPRQVTCWVEVSYRSCTTQILGDRTVMCVRAAAEFGGLVSIITICPDETTQN